MSHSSGSSSELPEEGRVAPSTAHCQHPGASCRWTRIWMTCGCLSGGAAAPSQLSLWMVLDNYHCPWEIPREVWKTVIPTAEVPGHRWGCSWRVRTLQASRCPGLCRQGLLRESTSALLESRVTGSWCLRNSCGMGICLLHHPFQAPNRKKVAVLPLQGQQHLASRTEFCKHLASVQLGHQCPQVLQVRSGTGDPGHMKLSHPTGGGEK